MKRFSEQFKKKSDSIRLRAIERADLRARLESYMEYHPLPADMKTVKKAPVRKVAQGLVSEPFKAISINMTYVRGFAGAFAIFMVVGIPVLAEWSVPGDVLYPVKTNITEEVRASLAFSPYAKVQWETDRVERRVAEAQLLASKGELTPEVEASVAEAIQTHTNTAVSEIALLREDSEDKAALAEIAFASALSVQADILADSQNMSDVAVLPEEGHSVAVLANVLADASGRADVAKEDTALSYETLLATIEMETTHAYELFQSVQTDALPQEVSDMKRRLDDIDRKVAQAIALHMDMDMATSTNAVVMQEVVLEEVPSTESYQVTSVETDVASEINLSDMATSTREFVGSTTEIISVDPPGVPDEDIATDIEITPSENPNPEDIKQEIPAGEIQKEQNNKAILILRDALTDVQRLIIFMTDLNVRENITVEELVPVVPTPEEETGLIIKELDTVLEIQEEIIRRADPITSDEKVLQGTEILAGQIESVSRLLEEGKINGAQKMVTQAHAIAEDIQKLLEKEPRRDIVPETKEPSEVVESEQGSVDSGEVSTEVVEEEVPVVEPGEMPASDNNM